LLPSWLQRSKVTWQTEVRAWALASAGVFCLGAVGYRVYTLPKLPDLSPTLTKLNLELDEAHRLTLEAGLTAMEARKASAKESSYLDRWNSQLSATMTDAQGVMVQTSETLAAMQGTVTALQAPITQATATLQAAQRSTEALQPIMAHLDTLVTNPQIADTIAQTDTTMKHIDVVTGDLQFEADKLIHPPKKKLGFWGSIWAGVQVAHKFEPPLF
jgi:hypothetical protein